VRVSVLVVGRPRSPGLAEAIRDFEVRAARYWPLDVIEVKEEPARSGAVDHVRDREGDRLAARLTGDVRVVLCDPGGEELTSDQFAHLLSSQRDHAQNVAFVIGGAYGLGGVVRQRAWRRIALAPWTLPHELARLVLAEQLYRAGTIVRGEPYHK
jgi:23S rRNA (pseudouridine1915-N3)-methyltransferase